MKGLKLLLVEDSMDDEYLILKAFAREKIPVVHTRVDTRTAFTRALGTRPWDIIISDFNLPGFSGLEALSMLQATGKDIPFIIVSGAIGELTAVEAMRAGADDYLMKENLSRLVPVVERALREADNRQFKREAEQEIGYQAYLLDQVDEGIISLAEDLTIKSWSRGAEKIFGLVAAACTGRKLPGVLDINFYGRTPGKSLAGLVEQAPTWKGEVTILTRVSKRPHPVFLTIARLDASESFAGGIILICKDIEEIARAQHQLIESQSYIISAVENTADAIFALNLQHELIYFNSAYNQNFRDTFGRDAAIGLNLLDLSRGASGIILRENLHRVMEGEKFAYEHALPQVGGGTLTFEVSVSPIYGLNNQIIGITYLYRDITEKKRVAGQLQQLQAEILDNRLREQRIQSAALLEGQEGERKRLARELHDGLGQMLNALKLQLARENVTGNYRQTLDEIIGEVKRMNNNLMPLVLEDFGLEAGLRQLVEKYQLTTAAELYFFSDVKDRRFVSAFEVGVYRIVQEAVSNAVKYAQATHISVQVTHNEHTLLVMVEDDGQGFDPQATRPTGAGGYGLLNLKFRTEALGGKLEISSQPGNGCVVTVELPLPVAAPALPAPSNQTL